MYNFEFNLVSSRWYSCGKSQSKILEILPENLYLHLVRFSERLKKFNMNFQSSPTTKALILLLISSSLILVVEAQQNYNDPCDFATPCNTAAFLECIPLYSSLSNGTCRCRPGTVYHPQLFECLAETDAPCSMSSTEPACVPNSYCDFFTKKCTCQIGYYNPTVGSFCVAEYGAPCANVTTQFANCDITKRVVCYRDTANPDYDGTGKCACSGAYVWSSQRDKCLAKIETSSSCTVDDDCVDNGLCTNNGFGISRCRCGPGFSKDSSDFCSLPLGSSCNSTGGGVSCNTKEYLTCSALTNTCTCASPRVNVGGVCKGLVNDPCQANTDCLTSSVCHPGVKKCFCDLSDGYIELNNGTCGRLSTGAGSYCRVGLYYDCSPLNYLECKPITSTYGTCECEDGMIVDENKRCVRALGDVCSPLNHNCITNAGCINNVCACLPGSVSTSNSTKCLKTVNQVCNVGSTNQCNGEYGLSCLANRCSCPPGQEWSESKLHCVGLVSATCSPTENYCTEHSSCNSAGICECNNGYSQHSASDRHCLASYGTACNATTSCNEQQYLVCNPSIATCTCQYEQQQVWDSNLGSCVSRVGGYCGESLDENINRPGMECVESSTCVVDPNTKMSQCMCGDTEVVTDDGHCQLDVIPTTTSTEATIETTKESNQNDTGSMISSSSFSFILIIATYNILTTFMTI